MGNKKKISHRDFLCFGHGNLIMFCKVNKILNSIEKLVNRLRDIVWDLM